MVIIPGEKERLVYLTNGSDSVGDQLAIFVKYPRPWYTIRTKSWWMKKIFSAIGKVRQLSSSCISKLCSQEPYWYGFITQVLLSDQNGRITFLLWLNLLEVPAGQEFMRSKTPELREQVLKLTANGANTFRCASQVLDFGPWWTAYLADWIDGNAGTKNYGRVKWEIGGRKTPFYI